MKLIVPSPRIRQDSLLIGPKPGSRSEKSQMSGDDFNEMAAQAIAGRRWSEAREVLDTGLAGMPVGWKVSKESDTALQFAFWDQEEFLEFSRRRTSEDRRSVFWVTPSYSKAWWHLAVVCAEEQRLDNALVCVERGIEIEPDHPRLWIEKGFILNRLKRHAEAVSCYEQATLVRAWAPASQIARAFRGQGSALIDLGRLDDAETAYRRSLDLEPANETALQELEYIQDIRQERAERKNKLPWFLESLAHPPADPLTIQLLALVEDLESIPGPKTLGPENYSKVADAFIDRGWTGFEEAFDAIVPRSRSDYADVKRDLLRESIFNRRTHSNMARIMLGKATLEEVLDEVRRKEPLN
jgi:tetratricopeptide (TPR) repeat protein